VFWLSFADPLAIPAQVATCGGPAGLDLRPGFGDLPLNDQVRLVAAQWRGPVPRLLVFDGCEDEELFRTWRPPTGASQVLVTSRREAWTLGLGIRQVRLGTLARSASLALLCEQRDDLSACDGILDEIAEELGDLPLALHLSGSFLARYRHSELGEPARYLERLRRPDLLSRGASTTGGRTAKNREQHAARTFALSYERLNLADSVDAMAERTLARASCLAAGEPIPRRLLRASAGIVAQDEDSVLEFEEGILRLRELGLIAEEGNGTLVLHRMIAAFVRSEAADLSTVRGEIEAALLGEARALNEARDPAQLLTWQNHLRQVTARAAEAGSVLAADLLNSLGYHLDMVANFAGAEAAYRQVLAIDEARFGPWDPRVAVALNNLGSALHGRGDLEGARAAYERALAIDQKAYGPEHPKVAIRINNLGLLRQELADLAGAREAFERALAIDESAYGADAPEVATDVSNLGRVLRQQHDLEGARAAFQRALAIGEKALRPDHPDVAIYVNNLGSVLQDQGDLTGARAAYERALAIDEKVYGPEHPKIAIRINNIASVLRTEGKLEAAREAYERALAILQRCLGPEHPTTCKVCGHLRSLAEMAEGGGQSC
jgi:tetratricopeptide (TPR) repeat protein